MKTATRRTTSIFAAAAAIALSAGLATPGLAGGDASEWRYERYLAKEEAQRQASAETDRTDRQRAGVGATEFEGTGSEHPAQRTGAQRFYIDAPDTDEDDYRGF